NISLAMKIPRQFLLMTALLGACLLSAGCAQENGSLKSLGKHGSDNSTVKYGPAKLSPDELQSEVMNFADTYVTICTQALDNLRKSTSRPEVADWALDAKINTASTAYSDAV